MHRKPEDGNDRTFDEIGVVNANHISVICHSKENLSAGSIKERIEAFLSRIRPGELEFNSWAFCGRNSNDVIHVSNSYHIVHMCQ